MARTIKTKLAIDGEAQYKQSIAACNAELKVLKSSLTLVESEFRNNANSMEALTAKGSALEAMYQKQLEKVTTLETALLNAKRAQEEYASRISTAQVNIERCEQALERLRQSTEDTSGEQKALTEELGKYKAELEEARAGQAAAERGIQGWQRQLNNAKVELNGLSDAISKNDQYLREAEQSADGCAHSIDQYGKEVKQAGEGSAEFAEGAKRSSQGIEQLAAALAAAGVAKSVKEIADTLLECAGAAGNFETAMAKLSTLMVPHSMEYIKAKLVDLSNETGVAVGALTEAAYQARSAGVDAANVIDFVATATKTSAAGFTDSTVAVDVLTTAINAYRMEGSEAEKVASMLVKTQDEGKTSVGELAQNMGRVIPVAAAYNVSLGNLTTAYAQLTKNGTNTAIATTNLTAMFNELGKTGSTAANILQKQAGQSFAQLMDSGKNLGQIMTILSDSVDGDATAFSNLWGSTTAGQAALSLLNSGAEEFARTLDVLENSSGAVERNFQTMADTTEFARQRMENAAENLKIAIGDQLNPALEKLYATGADAFTWATDFVNENPAVVAALTAMTIGMATLTAGVTLAANAENIMAASTALLNAVMNANPAFLMAAAIAGLVTTIGTFIAVAGSASDETRDFAKSLQESKAAYDDLMASMGEQQTSTASTVAALKELLAVENKTAAQKKIIKQMVDELNEAIPGLSLNYDQERDALVGMTEAELDAAAARSAAQEEHEAQVDRLKELYVEKAEIEERLLKAEDDLTAAQEDLTDAQRAGGDQVVSYADGTISYNSALEASIIAAGALERDVRELTAAQADNAAQIAELEKETGAYAQQQAEAERQTQAMSATMGGLIAEMEGLQAAYNESYNSAMESITAQLGLFKELDGEAKTSIDNLIGTLEGQVSYMEAYAGNLQRAMEMGVDEGLVKKLSDGSEESAQILAAIVQGGEEKITALNEQFAKVEEGKEAFSNAVAEMETDFAKQMDAVAKDLENALQEMKMEDEAYQIGQNNIQGLIDGAASKKMALVNTYIELARESYAAYQRESDQHSPSKKFKAAGRYDVQGLIQGVEEERQNLAAAYEATAQAALDGMARHLPSTIEDPQAGAAIERSMESITAAAVNAISGIGGSGNDTPIVLNLMLPDGTAFASYYFDPLTKYADANGTPILNPIK